MNDGRLHPDAERISDWIDGELEGAARGEVEAHVATCGDCRALADELEALVRAARALPDRAPEHDLWPALAARLDGPRARRRGPRPLATLGALVAAAGIVALLWTLTRGGATPEHDVRPRFVFVLHEPQALFAESDAVEVARAVDEYRRWAQGLGARGQLEAGEKLADREGFELFPGRAPVARGEGGGIGGFFVVRAADYEEALALARGCPHLAHGGWIEIRRIEET
jgi:hypothetical protein